MGLDLQNGGGALRIGHEVVQETRIVVGHPEVANLLAA